MPANDPIANATLVTGASGSIAGTLVGASLETGEPKPYSGVVASVWYKFTPSTDTILELWLDFPTDQQAEVSLYQYWPDAPSQTFPYLYTQSQGFPGNQQYPASMPIGDVRVGAFEAGLAFCPANVTSYIQVAGDTLSGDSLGPFTLYWRTIAPPSTSYIPTGRIEGTAQLFYFEQSVREQFAGAIQARRTVILAWNNSTQLIPYNALPYLNQFGGVASVSNLFLAAGDGAVIVNRAAPAGSTSGSVEPLPTWTDRYYAFDGFSSTAMDLTQLDSMGAIACVGFSTPLASWFTLTTSGTLRQSDSTFQTTATYTMPNLGASYLAWDGPFFDPSGNLYVANHTSTSFFLYPWSPAGGLGAAVLTLALTDPTYGLHANVGNSLGRSRSFLGFRTATTALWAYYSSSGPVTLHLTELPVFFGAGNFPDVSDWLFSPANIPTAAFCVMDPDSDFVWISAGTGSGHTVVNRFDLRSAVPAGALAAEFTLFDPYPVGSQNAGEFVDIVLRACVPATLGRPRGISTTSGSEQSVRRPAAFVHSIS